MDLRNKMVITCDDEVQKHRKKKESSVSKSIKKAKHKHIYKQVLVENYGMLSLGKVCTVCGKVVITDYLITEKLDNGMRLMLDRHEIVEKYKNLEIISI